MNKIKNEKNEPIMKLNSINKIYNTKNKKIKVLSDLSVTFYNKNFYAIMGHSGSVKSTLLNILGLIDKFDDGQYYLYGENVDKFNDINLSNLRMKNLGFIFQDFNLNPTLKAYENVIVPMLINKEINPKNRKSKAIQLLEDVGLGERIEHYPKELSGGEQQRVAIARALANDPYIILADEPTGNLDEKTGRDILYTLKELSKKGKCIIVVSHSDYVREYADIVYKITNGTLVSDKNENK